MSSHSDTILVAFVAKSVGASHDVIAIMISVFLGYPLAIVYRKIFYGTPPMIQHLYFIACGFFLSYFNFGSSAIHPIINLAVIYVLLLFFQGSLFSVIFAFVFNTLYVFCGCVIFNPGTYGVDWTTSQCIICLKLTGLTMDLYDAKKSPEKLSKEQKETLLRGLPSLLEVAGYMYFFGGFLVGPQFYMKRYQDLVRGVFSDRKTGGLPNSVVPALKRLLGGIVYTVAFQTVHIFLPVDYLSTETFRNSGFLTRMATIAVWGKFELYKYLGVWQLSDGVCTLVGLTYNGEDEQGNVLWDACPGTDVVKFESTNKCEDLVHSFNISTNRWMLKHVYKRLRFLGNRTLSQVFTLFYLAFWHGLWSGYYHTFFMEFVVVGAEKGVADIYTHSSSLRGFLTQTWMRPLVFCLRKLYAWVTIGYMFLGYTLFTYDKFIPVYSSVYFVLHIPFLVWPFIFPYLRSAFVDRPKSSD